MNTTLDMMTPMDAMDAVPTFTQAIPLTKAGTHDVWVCALKASLSLSKDDRSPVGWMSVVAEDDASWTVEIHPWNQWVSAENLAKSVDTFQGYLWGYGRRPVAYGRRVTFVKQVNPRDVRSH